MKKHTFITLTAVIMLASTLFINIGNATDQTTYTITSNGQITQNSSTQLTIILRNICITTINPNNIDINSWVDNYIANHNYATAVTLSDMHQYGIWWYGYSFSKTSGIWMGWTYQQLKTMIDRFHYNGWKVGLESTGVAWNNQEEYNYITEKHPELAFTDGNGLRATGIDNTAKSTKNPGYNRVIPDFFAKFATNDPVNNIPIGTRLIDLYTTRLEQMIDEGLEWDFWFGTDGWNGFNIQGYTWSSINPEYCYSFSEQEMEEWANTVSFETSSSVIGLNSVNSYLWNTIGSNTKIESGFICYSNGTITWVSAYLGANTATNVQLAVYNGTQETPSALLTTTNELSVSADKWYNFTLATPINVIADNYYHFSLCSNGSIKVYNQYGGNTTGNNQKYAEFSDDFGIVEKQLSFNGKSIDIYTEYQTLESWNDLSITQKRAQIINNELHSWSQYWQDRFAQMYAQIKQVFIDAGKSSSEFYTIGSADLSTLSKTGNLSPYGMYNLSLIAEYNSLDYIYVDQEIAVEGSLGENQATIGRYIKEINSSLTPIIGLQLVNWLGEATTLLDVKEEYFLQASEVGVFESNIIMMQYPTNDGWSNWEESDVKELINYIREFVEIS